MEPKPTKAEMALEACKLIIELNGKLYGDAASEVMRLAREAIKPDVCAMAHAACKAIRTTLENNMPHAVLPRNTPDLIEQHTRCGEMRALLVRWYDARNHVSNSYPQPFIATKTLLDETQP